MHNNDFPKILWLKECCREHLPRVGGKNVGLGEMIQAGVRVPSGFAVTTDTYVDFINKAGINKKINEILSTVVVNDIESEEKASEEICRLMESAPLPVDKEDAIVSAYNALCEECDIDDVPVAVRSSATAEDLPGASFA